MTTVEPIIRLVTPADRELVRAMHQRCSVESLAWRCLQPPVRATASGGHDEVPDPLVDWMFDPELGTTMLIIDPSSGDVVGLAHLTHTDEPGVDAVAFLLEDAWQGKGLGGKLVDIVTAVARKRGLRGLTADVALDNDRMLRILFRRGWVCRPADGAYLARLDLTERP